MGTIPANTGKIPRVRAYAPPGWDHPREYGENKMLAMVPLPHSGPSPRIRGKYSLETNQTCELGTIPANTGKISRRES